MKILNRNISAMLAIFAATLFVGCEEEQDYPTTRLFKPVLTQELTADGNKIVVNLGNSSRAMSYSFEMSRDTFRTVEYQFETDTNYFVIDESIVGEELFWNTRYQLRALAHADEPKYNSLWSDLGGVRTQKFPSNLYEVKSNDVIDVTARVIWARTGLPITKVAVFDVNDKRLVRPLTTQTVTEAEEAAGVKYVTGLSPLTTYQIAIYDESSVRGWQNYTTIASIVDKNDPNVIDITASTDPDAAINAYVSATDGQVILLKKGMTYNLPQSGTNDADKSITFVGDIGFEAQLAKFYTTGNWNIAPGSNIDHIRFKNMEVAGEDWGGDYVLNPSITGATTLKELTFEDCIIHDFRGVMRIRGDMFVTNYNIKNSVVYHIGGYGIVTCDTDGAGKAAVDNIVLENSTFHQVQIGIQTRQNTQSVLIESCTFNQFPQVGLQMFRYRGAEGFDQSINGVTINNSIFGDTWDVTSSGVYATNLVDGLTTSAINVVNNYGTTNFLASEGNEVTGLPNTVYSGTSADLFEDTENLDFGFKDTGFAGKYDAGDPRWRPE